MQRHHKYRLRKLAVIMVALLVPVYAAGAIHLESVDIKGGMIWIGNAPVDAGGTDAAPSPLTALAGVSFPIRFTDFFLLAPELRYFGQPYGIEYGRPVPVEIEFAEWAYVMGLMLEPRALFDFQITPALAFGAYISPSFLFRIPAKIWGDTSRAIIAAYQYGMGRFFYPEIGVAVDWEIPFRVRSKEAESLNEGEFEEDDPYEGISIHLIVDISAYFPIFHAWDKEAVPLYDQFMASGVVGLQVFLPD
jgi:hypothetical protein